MQDKGYICNLRLTKSWMVSHKASWSTHENNLKLANFCCFQSIISHGIICKNCTDIKSALDPQENCQKNNKC